MLIRDLLRKIPEEVIIAHAILADRCLPDEVDGWITKYYALLFKLKKTKVKNSALMFYLSTVNDKFTYGDVCGFLYNDIKARKVCRLAIGDLSYMEYASLYVPDYTIECYGEEVVAGEALREYGWNNFDKNIICPANLKVAVRKILKDMKHELFLSDNRYMMRCQMEFCQNMRERRRKAREDRHRECRKLYFAKENLYFITDYIYNSGYGFDIVSASQTVEENYVREGVVAILNERYSLNEIDAIANYLKFHFHNALTDEEYDSFLKEFKHSDAYIRDVLWKPINPKRYRKRYYKRFCRKPFGRNRKPKDYLD